MINHTLPATLASLVLLVVVLDLVRRRRLFERYAILWLASAIALLAMSVWGGLLGLVAHALGIQAPPNALFAIALGGVLVLLLHFSVAVSRLSDQSKVLAQRLALMEDHVRQLSAQLPEGEEGGEQPAAAPVALSERTAAPTASRRS